MPSIEAHHIAMQEQNPSTAPTLEQLQKSLDQLKATGIKLEATRQQYEEKMRRSRQWNLGAVVLAVLVCIVAWINHASPWLRWGVLPIMLFLVLFFEAMRRLLGVTMQSSIRQLKIQIAGLETRIAEAQASKSQALQEPELEQPR